MLNHRIFLFSAAVLLLFGGFVFAEQYPSSDLNEDGFVDFADYTILAQNWQKTGTAIDGDFDDDGSVDIDDLQYLAYYWLTEHWKCEKADFNYDGIVNFGDMTMLAENWLESGSGFVGDFDDSNTIDFYDLKTFTDCWLEGSQPEETFDSFKAALAAGDVNQAITFVADISKEKYTEILEAIEPNLPDFAAGMGAMTLTSAKPGEVKYEMLHQDGGDTYSFPVFFIKDEDNNWKIFNF